MSLPDLSPAITEVANNPSTVTTDGLTVAAQPIQDLIAADRYLKANAALGTRKRGLVFNRLRLPKQVDVPPHSGPNT